MRAMSGEGLRDATGVGSGTTPSLTRAFLFADLRGYTKLVETHGAARAADLLERYRALVRPAVGAFGGAEIKTEGDSFYVVFDSVSASVRCGLAIQGAAAEASAEVPDPPIRVGVGIHAGETVAVADGFVGSAVNVAARLCALAGPGEVLVSDTVRTLTQTVVPVVFEPRGRQRLKGVPDPVPVYSVVPVADADDAWAAGIRAERARRIRRRRILAGVAGVTAVALVAGFVVVLIRPAPSLPSGPWTIGLSIPLTGPMGPDFGVGIADATRLAVQEVNASGDLGIELQVDLRDHGAPAIEGDLDKARANIDALVADPRAIAVLGPVESWIATEQIPITNQAGLLHCSPATTGPNLTKPRNGALDIRASAPDRINFIRTAPADDIQGKATASFLFNDLGVRHLLVVHDTEVLDTLPADSVSAAFDELGGRVTRRSLNPGAAPATVLEPLASTADAPAAVFYSGVDFGDLRPRAIEVRKAMTEAGHGDIPFVAWDWIGLEPDMITAMGPGAAGAYVTHASFAPPRSAFADRFRAAYGREPAEFDSAAYACMEVIIAALRDVARQGVSADAIREAVRASAVDTTNRYETVLGTIGFDANGDSLQQFAQIFRADQGSAAREPEWVIEKAQDYGPAP
jgi:class 3 adenylate cyclase/ABC-type branched-subunit amino acid transport system substrate-binding protein